MCLGFPGALPVVNRDRGRVAIGSASRSAAGLRRARRLARKNYFYPDLPKGYQITQYDLPFCTDGAVLVPTAAATRARHPARAPRGGYGRSPSTWRAHGRIRGADHSLVDFNRCGTPLLEIVTARTSARPTRRALPPAPPPDDRRARDLRRRDGEGTLRWMRTSRSDPPARRSSARASRAQEPELLRLRRARDRRRDRAADRRLGAGGEVAQETYDFEAAHGALTPHRAKEEAADYRYFPEPDLVPVEPPRVLVEELRSELPELPSARIGRLEAELNLDRATVLVIGGLDRLWQETVSSGADKIPAANVIANNLVGAGVDPAAVPARELARLVDGRERISRTAFDEAISRLTEPGFSADPYLAQEAVATKPSSSRSSSRVLEASPDQVEAFRRARTAPRLLRRPGHEGDPGQGQPPRRVGALACKAERMTVIRVEEEHRFDVPSPRIRVHHRPG